MDDRIKVHVVKYTGRDNLVMRYVDPDSGRQVIRSTGTTNRRDADRAAAKWEAELREGRYQKRSRLAWPDFRAEFERDVLDGLKAATAAAYLSTLNVFERKCRPGRLAEVTTAKLTAFVTMLRDDHLATATIARHLRTLKVAMRWAHRQGLLLKLPEFTMPKGPKGMKGRPITGEEFERMLGAVPEATKSRPNTTGVDDVERWQFYLNGLWWSGLRLGESLELRWDDAPGALVADFTGRRPMLRIPAESEKGNTHRLLPMAPEFAQLLLSVPEGQRRGYVFKLPPGVPRKLGAVCQRIVATGAVARVVVKQREKLDAEGEPVTVNEFASAHDLRRSFGFRWSRRVMPTILRELMRHESIDTTMRYYVGQNAESTADELWRAAGIISGIPAAKEVDGGGIEPPTHGFSVHCSTN
jgi:integrase